jgi:hypothetical protein
VVISDREIDASHQIMCNNFWIQVLGQIFALKEKTEPKVLIFKVLEDP